MTARAPMAVLAVAWSAALAPAQTPATRRESTPAETTFVREHDVAYLLRLPGLLTGNTFKKGHRIRVHVMPSFAPNPARNLQTDASETQSARMRSARITIHHDARHPSRIISPVIPSEAHVVPSGARDLHRPDREPSLGSLRIPRLSARDDKA